MTMKQEYYLAGNPWGTQEDEQLIREYITYKLNFMDICKIHKRLPGGISSRLILHNLVDCRQNIRGYTEYQESELYKEICAANREKHAQATKPVHTVEPTNANSILPYLTPKQKDRQQRKSMPSDILELKKDVKEIHGIKENVTKILELIHAIYEFENETEAQPQSDKIDKGALHTACMDTAKTVISFGKHNGKTYEMLKQTDVAYCNWVLKQMNVGSRMLHFQEWLKTNTRKITCECCNGSGYVDAV